jgi:large subunit ribosomal protein L28
VARKCDNCAKTISFGLSRTYRGLAKAKGGVGIKNTGKTRRKFKPNLQNVRVTVDGGVKRMRVCTGCIRSGLIRKRVKREIPEDVRQRMLQRAS